MKFATATELQVAAWTVLAMLLILACVIVTLGAAEGWW